VTERTKQDRGRLIVFEGPDGVGKSTLSRAFADHLREHGSRCELMSFPGRDPGTLGQLVYQLHHDDPTVRGISRPTPTSLQALHIAAHLEAIERRIVPALDAGADVILDRFWWSTWVYGVAGGVNRRVLEGLIDAERAAWEGVTPHVVVLVRRPAPIDREDPLPLWLKLRDGYDRLARKEAALYAVQVVENTATPSEGLAQIVRVVEAPKTGVLPALVRGRARGRERHRGQQETSKSLFGDEDSGDDGPAETTAGPLVLTHLLPVKPTVVFDTYWRFAAERQAVFFRRFGGSPPPWTDDNIVAQYKFTNAYRASDRVSQYLIRRVIYRDDLPASVPEVFFRVMLFKLFNKIETWERLEAEFKNVTFEGYSFKAYDRVLSQAMTRGESIYSAAYIMPSGGSQLGHDRKHRNHLSLLERMMTDRLPEQVAGAPNMQRVFELLRGYPTIGDFLAYQYATDLNYSEVTNFTEMEFVVPGPGALDGIRKCFADRGGLSEPEIIRLVADRQEREFERLGLTFQSLWGRPLQLIDCQNLFCEVDKYSRVRHPTIAGISGRTRIKQKYVRHPGPLSYWYPPKWRINERIANEQQSARDDRRWVEPSGPIAEGA
jgi:thymidylate kinase